MTLETGLTKALGVKHPLVQGPMASSEASDGVRCLRPEGRPLLGDHEHTTVGILVRVR
jgi:hypothetical protein